MTSDTGDLADPEDVKAAGGLVWRRGAEAGSFDIVVVHRPDHDDWSLPKGKLDPGEEYGEAAVREVEEETGLRCQLGVELDPVQYTVDGRSKIVRYWAMTVVDGEARPTDDDEVDEVRWVDADEAADLLTYDRDVALVQAWRSTATG